MYNYTDNVCVSVYHMVCTLLIPYMEWPYCQITALYNYINEVVDTPFSYKWIKTISVSYKD